MITLDQYKTSYATAISSHKIPEQNKTTIFSSKFHWIVKRWKDLAFTYYPKNYLKHLTFWQTPVTQRPASTLDLAQHKHEKKQKKKLGKFELNRSPESKENSEQHPDCNVQTSVICFIHF